jgi:hypothetical protein
MAGFDCCSVGVCGAREHAASNSADANAATKIGLGDSGRPWRMRAFVLAWCQPG